MEFPGNEPSWEAEPKLPTACVSGPDTVLRETGKHAEATAPRTQFPLGPVPTFP